MIFDYKDELNEHFEDINGNIDMVAKDSNLPNVGVKLNRKSLTRFHAKLTKILKAMSIPTKSDEDLGLILSSVAKIQDQLRAQNSEDQIRNLIKKLKDEIFSNSKLSVTKNAKDLID